MMIPLPYDCYQPPFALFVMSIEQKERFHEVYKLDKLQPEIIELWEKDQYNFRIVIQCAGHPSILKDVMVKVTSEAWFVEDDYDLTQLSNCLDIRKALEGRT